MYNDLTFTGLKIKQDENGFKFSLDSVLLADFIKIKPEDKLIELGCGNGAVLLYLSQKTKNKLFGVDILESATRLAYENAMLNKLDEQIKIYNLDARNCHLTLGANTFNLVVSNPPYFKIGSGKINSFSKKSCARHEESLSFSELTKAAKRLLVDKGSFVFINRAERIGELSQILFENNFGIIELRFVYPKLSKDKALLVLIKARLNAHPETKVLNPLYLHKEDGSYSEEVISIYNLRRKE